MGFYQTENLRVFKVQNNVNLIQSKLQLINSTIASPLSVAIYDSPTGVIYSASDLLNGYIIRQGQDPTIMTIDQIDTASNIIQQLKTRYTSITNLGYSSSTDTSSDKVVPPGTSFICEIYNNVPTTNVLNDNELGLQFFTDANKTVRIGGYTDENDPQIVNGATAILEIIVQDQAALGSGHIDQVFVCISRCATAIQLPDQP